MKRKLFYLILALVFGLICCIVILNTGKTAYVQVDAKDLDSDPEECEFYIEDPENAIVVDQKIISGTEIFIQIHSDSSVRRVVYMGLQNKNAISEKRTIEVVYVHPGSVITVNTFLGRCRGDRIVSIFSILYFLIIVIDLVTQLNRDIWHNLHQYRNIKTLGLLLFFGSILLLQFIQLPMQQSLYDRIYQLLESTNGMAYIVLPIAFVLSIFVTATNVRLMMREGYTWRNMLGCFLGVAFLVATILPIAFSEYLYSNISDAFWDVHRSNGLGRHAELLLRTTVLSLVFYMECVLAAVIILSLIAAKRKPEPDKDYILIHGCMIRKDGTPTPLLRGRADKALEYGRIQKERTGREPIYVASGGQGSDEIISEAECISNYLQTLGVAKEQILIEDRSTTTRENMNFSYDLIKEQRGGDMTGVKVAFATTNYHVFRSGVLASEAGFVGAQGIGGPTKAYFWINAFVREFIAIMSLEWKTHAYVMTLMAIADFVMVVVVYIVNNM
ncbi:MAG: YdcF family protein [Lachnospiraceae bacterium]|nr:YdcF family protein [Lachnospiraceae bacterium]